MRKHKLNKRFFRLIDTPEKAYWLGFIAADGGIQHGNGVHALTVGLAAKDRGHLLKLRRALGSTAPIGARQKSNSFVLGIYSKELLEDLATAGLPPGKERRGAPWSGPAHLLPHYWRGVLDGDGCIHRSRNSWVVGFCGNFAMVSGFAHFIEQSTGHLARVYLAKNIYRVHYAGSRLAKRVVAVLYSGPPALARKEALARAVLAAPPKNRDYSHVTQETLSATYAKLGSWGRVARALSIERAYLNKIRHRRATEPSPPPPLA